MVHPQMFQPGFTSSEWWMIPVKTSRKLQSLGDSQPETSTNRAGICRNCHDFFLQKVDSQVIFHISLLLYLIKKAHGLLMTVF